MFCKDVRPLAWTCSIYYNSLLHPQVHVVVWMSMPTLAWGLELRDSGVRPDELKASEGVNAARSAYSLFLRKHLHGAKERTRKRRYRNVLIQGTEDLDGRMGEMAASIPGKTAC